MIIQRIQEAAGYPIEALNGRGPGAPRVDAVAVEAALEVRFSGRPATVLMRTPGRDEELVRGFLFSEGMIGRADDVLSLRRPEGLPAALEGHVIDVQLAPGRKRPGLDRSFISSASCGACGKRSIESLEVHADRIESAMTVRREVLTSLPDRLREAQPTFSLTGGVHASGLFTPDGTLVAVREDVGRHNALDKLVGWALGEGLLPLDGHVLLLSGRVSYELVQKAVVAGIPVVAAVGAPSSLAVDMAARFNLTLAGFLRPGGMNVYTGGCRIE
ncbi:MAG: formate dehydrogenase accessory sulfurtransferase FdhD [Isosphaeraceae bacterium]